MKKLLLAATMLVALASGAQAVTVNATDIGASGTTNIQGFVDVNGNAVSIPGLTATLFLEFNGVTGNTWSFDYTLTNTSSNNISAARISSWALGTTPNVTSATSTGLYGFVDLTPNYPNVNGAQSFLDFCVTPVDGNCSSGSGLLAGEAASGILFLTFATQLASISLDSALTRFQSIDSGAPYNFVGASGVGFNVGDVTINPLGGVGGELVV